MTDSVQPLADDGSSARPWGRRFGDESDDLQESAPFPPLSSVSVHDVEWRHDPSLRQVIRPVDSVGTVPSTSPSANFVGTFVLVEGGATVVAMTRAEAIEAGYTVLDEDDSIETNTTHVPSAATVESSNPTPAPVPAARHLRLLPSTPASDEHERINDWLRTVSRNRGAKSAGPIPGRNLSVVQPAEEVAVPTDGPAIEAPIPLAPQADRIPTTSGTPLDLLPAASVPAVNLFPASSVPLDDLFAVDVARETSVAAAPERTVRLVAAPPQSDVLAGTVLVPRIPQPDVQVQPSRPQVSPAQALPVPVPVAIPSIGTQSPLRAPLAATAPVLVAARSLTKTYVRNGASHSVFRDVTIDLHLGEFVAVVGPSASGKTTLLNCLSGLEDCDDGEVLFDGYPLSALTESDRARHRVATMGFAFPKPDLISVLTAVENVELPLSIAGWKFAEARAEATSALTLFRVGDVANELPETLSAGERLRVSLARGVVGEPKIVWADEATAGVDPETSDEIAHVLRELNEEGLAVVVATHDVGVLRHAHRIFELRDGLLKEASRRKVLDACHRRLS